MNKYIVWILAILIVVITLFYFFKPSTSEAPVAGQDEEAAYFADRMVALAIEDVGMAIEGFDDNLLHMAYPGLMASDFDGVETLEGHYEIKNGESVFVRDQKMPVSSAERTISEGGYKTLLNNLSERLNMNA